MAPFLSFGETPEEGHNRGQEAGEEGSPTISSQQDTLRLPIGIGRPARAPGQQPTWTPDWQAGPWAHAQSEEGGVGKRGDMLCLVGGTCLARLL